MRENHGVPKVITLLLTVGATATRWNGAVWAYGPLPRPLWVDWTLGISYGGYMRSCGITHRGRALGSSVYRRIIFMSYRPGLIAIVLGRQLLDVPNEAERVGDITAATFVAKSGDIAFDDTGDNGIG